MRAALVVLLSLAVACADDAPTARGPSQAKPMDQPRAQQVIARTFQAQGVQPEAGRSFTLTAAGPTPLLVAAQGHKYGVLWLTRARARDLAALLPAHSGDEGALVVLNGVGADADVHALTLWETDYMTDDLAGASHSETEVAAEAKLERDVRDFLVKAKDESWP
jgi:hypothetical protein